MTIAEIGEVGSDLELCSQALLAPWIYATKRKSLPGTWSMEELYAAPDGEQMWFWAAGFFDLPFLSGYEGDFEPD